MSVVYRDPTQAPLLGHCMWTTPPPIERSTRARLLLLISVFYFASTLIIAGIRPLWFDELFTVHLARLPNTAQLWAALNEGVDVTPPLFNLITRLSVACFGANEIAYRLPEILGVWILSVCLFLFVLRRCSIFHAAAAMLLTYCLRSATYATEARPYGLVLGGCGISLLSWQTACGRRHRKLAIGALALSLALTASVHYYGALFALPLVFGEAVRTWQRKKIDYPVAGALLATPLTLLAHWPWIRIAMSYSGGGWSAANMSSLTGAYGYLLGPILAMAVPAIGIVVLSYAAYRYWHGSRWQSPLPLWEMATVAAMLGLPVVCLIVAKATNGIFTARYAIPAVIGLALSLSVAPFPVRRFQTLGFAYFLAFAVLAFSMQAQRIAAMILAKEVRVPERLRQELETQETIVMNNSHLYLQVSYYLPERLRSRLFYVASPEQARHYMNADDDDRSLLLLSRWAPINVLELGSFVRHHPRFVVIGRREDNWLLPHLEDVGMPVRSRTWDEASTLWTVTQAPSVPSEGSASRSRLR